MSELKLNPEQLRQVDEHLSACLPEEGCGLLGGTGSEVGLVLAVENELHSPIRFQMKPIAQFKAMMQIESAQMDLLAIFHSHPTGPAYPSPTDVAEFYYPGTLVLIASPYQDSITTLPDGVLSAGSWQLRGFRIDKSEIIEVKLKCMLT